MKTRLYIVEDHEFVRESLIEFVRASSHLTYAGSSATAEHALESLSEWCADVVLVDVSLPGMSGLDFVAALRDLKPEARCLMLSGHPRRTYADAAMAVGAWGYIEKNNLDDLTEAICSVSSGATFLRNAS